MHRGPEAPRATPRRGAPRCRELDGREGLAAPALSLLLALASAGSIALASCQGPSVKTGPADRGEAELRALEEIERRGVREEAALLERALESPHRAVRARAARALGRSPFRAPTGPLAELLRPGEYEHVRRDAAWALGNGEGPSAREVLLGACRDPSPRVRAAAIRGIYRLGGDVSTEWLSWARDVDPEVRREAFFIADRAPASFTPDEARRLLDGEEDPGVRWSIIQAVSRSPALAEALRPELMRAAASPSFLEAVPALEALRRAPSDTLPPEVIEMASRPRAFWMARAAALEAMEAHLARPSLDSPCRESIESAIVACASAVLRAPGDIHVLRRAERALASCGSKAAADRLRALLDGRDPRSRRAAISGVLHASEGFPPDHPVGSRARDLISDLSRDPSSGAGIALTEALARKGIPERDLAQSPGADPSGYDLPPPDPGAWGSALLRKQRSLPVKRSPRAVIAVEGKGEIVLDLYAADAPHHAGSFLHLVRQGYPAGSRIGSVDPTGSIEVARAEGDVPAPAGKALPDESHLDVLVRGSVYSLPVSSGKETRAGSLRIALRPLPELHEKATVWGRVALGFETLDALEEGDLIERATIYE